MARVIRQTWEERLGCVEKVNSNDESWREVEGVESFHSSHLQQLIIPSAIRLLL
jgi:hypothetical protein